MLESSPSFKKKCTGTKIFPYIVDGPEFLGVPTNWGMRSG